MSEKDLVETEIEETKDSIKETLTEKKKIIEDIEVEFIFHPTPTPTPSPTFTPTPTYTPSPTPTLTPTYTPSFTPTETPSETPSFTPTFTEEEDFTSPTPTLLDDETLKSPTPTPVDDETLKSPTPTPIEDELSDDCCNGLTSFGITEEIASGNNPYTENGITISGFTSNDKLCIQNYDENISAPDYDFGIVASDESFGGILSFTSKNVIDNSEIIYKQGSDEVCWIGTILLASESGVIMLEKTTDY